ncbi:hypothetical protein UCMB321_5127 [Pseudomonas batumici]|uniref:Uncharacterized protein n=1 Tax=Pseudomonas batumici TaxID=226910 RepID=A0A0C2I7U0_9PSED|nr:hypothetical protein UCMB321_5127 [Pseudomonas batumici]
MYSYGKERKSDALKSSVNPALKRRWRLAPIRPRCDYSERLIFHIIIKNYLNIQFCAVSDIAIASKPAPTGFVPYANSMFDTDPL